MTPDPRTAPDRLRAFLAEHDVIDADKAYDELTQDPDLLVDVLRCLGVLGRPTPETRHSHVSSCGQEER